LSLFDTGLAAVRSLGRRGLPVVGFDHVAAHVGFASRYGRFELGPDPVTEGPALLERLVALGQSLDRRGVLFPASDAYVLFLSRYREALAPYFHMALADPAVIEGLVDKRRQYDMARAAGLEIPDTAAPTGPHDLARVQEAIRFPALIKPCYSHLGMNALARRKALRVDRPEELPRHFAALFASGQSFLVQSIVPGPNTHHFKVCAYLSRTGEALVHFTMRKIRQYPADFGVGSLVESIRDPELVDLGMRFFRHIRYRGIGSIEFKRDERDGRLKLIELNPRLWQQNALASACGVDFAWVQYADLTGGAGPWPESFRTGVRWLDLERDARTCFALYRAGELDLASWLRSYLGTRVFAKFAWDDPGPWLRSLSQGFRTPAPEAAPRPVACVP